MRFLRKLIQQEIARQKEAEIAANQRALKVEAFRFYVDTGRKLPGTLYTEVYAAVDARDVMRVIRELAK